ncbi:fungal-specific transcription factor domain-containing protein [Xylariaceae sp. FL1272]|nr:fungal-specific transcription factor domain-containing protein [Xylariaceae sp. FL1272]
MASNPAKPPRVLACVLCQSKKVRCDRNTPCSNCNLLIFPSKANVQCTPSTPAPPRKRRRPNQDLQQRLARCEELLSEYTTHDRTPTSSHDTPSRDELWKPFGKLIVDGENVKFTDSHLWADVHRELSAMREILEDDEIADDYYTPADSRTPDTNVGLLLSDPTDSSVEEFRPSPAQAFRLWQTFIERVNPLTKVIHVPTVQPQLVEATNNPTSMATLLFSIYLMGAVALNERECEEQLGYTKEHAYRRFANGCRTALMRIGMFSLAGRFDRHGAWILNGIVVRVAQKMGLHRDGELLGLPPFETEMRRRIWWQIIMIDALYALMSGLGQSLLPRSWDTKTPININDADLYPTMTTLHAKDGPTDMIYCLTFYEIGKMMMDSPNLESLIVQNEAGLLDPSPSEEIEKARRRILQLNDTLEEILDKYSDPSMGPVHQLAADIRPMLCSKLQEFVRPASEQPEWGTEIKSPRDNIFKIAVSTTETDMKLYQKLQAQGPFFWYMLAHFQIEMLIYMAGQLIERTSGSLVERAWLLVEAHYNFHDELYILNSKTHIALAILVTRGWRARERYLREAQGSLPATPDFIVKLLRILASNDNKAVAAVVEENTAMNPEAAPLFGAGAQGLEIPWDQMLGYTDVPALDWNMFSNNTVGDMQSNQGGYGTGYGNWGI